MAPPPVGPKGRSKAKTKPKAKPVAAPLGPANTQAGSEPEPSGRLRQRVKLSSVATGNYDLRRVSVWIYCERWERLKELFLGTKVTKGETGPIFAKISEGMADLNSFTGKS